MAQRWSAGRSHAWWPDTAAGNRKRNMGSGDKWQHEPWWSWPGSGVSWEASTPAWDYEDWGIEARDPEEYSSWAAQRSTESVGRSACKHFLQGRCQWGNACRFAHGPTDGPAPAEPVQLASGTASDPYEAGEVAYIAQVPPDGDSHVCEGSRNPRSQSSLPAFAPVPPESAVAASAEQHEVQSSPRDREDTEVGHAEDALAEEEVAKVPKATCRHPRKPLPRLWCQILLHKPHPNFGLVGNLIGRGGCNMREIHQATKAKVQIRGKGSGYYEVDGEREAPVPLMVVVTSDSQDADVFKKAVRMTLARLHDISKLYRIFCQHKGLHCDSNEQLFSIGEHSWGSEELLGEELSSISISSRDRDAAEGGQRGAGSKNRGNRSGDGADSSGHASGAKTKRRDAHGSESASSALGCVPPAALSWRCGAMSHGAASAAAADPAVASSAGAAASTEAGDSDNSKPVKLLNAGQHVLWHDDPMHPHAVLVLRCTDKELLDVAVKLFEQLFGSNGSFQQAQVQPPIHIYEEMNWPDPYTLQGRVVGGQHDGIIACGTGVRGGSMTNISRCARLACCLSALIFKPVEVEKEFLRLTSTMPKTKLQWLAVAAVVAFRRLPPRDQPQAAPPSPALAAPPSSAQAAPPAPPPPPVRPPPVFPLHAQPPPQAAAAHPAMPPAQAAAALPALPPPEVAVAAPEHAPRVQPKFGSVIIQQRPAVSATASATDRAPVRSNTSPAAGSSQFSLLALGPPPAPAAPATPAAPALAPTAAPAPAPAPAPCFPKAPAPVLLPHPTSVPAPAPAPAQVAAQAPVPSAMGATVQADHPPVQRGCEGTPLSPGIPPECLSDPYAELRQWEHGGGQLWPYCTLCTLWSDSAHVASKKHMSRLTNQGYHKGPDGTWVKGFGQQQQPAATGTTRLPSAATQMLALPSSAPVVGMSTAASSAALPGQEQRQLATTTPQAPPPAQRLALAGETWPIPTAAEIYMYNMRAMCLNGFIDWGSLANTEEADC